MSESETNGNGTQEETQDNIASTLASAIELQEAPISWNVRYYAKGYECQLTMRDFTANSLLPRTVKAIEWLEAHGYEPRMPRGNGNGSAPAPANAGGEANAPTCQYHGKMKRSTKFAGWYCTAKMGDDSYCKEVVKD